MALGALIGVLASMYGFTGLVSDWIKPFGTIFINMLKLIAVPLILITLVKGISSLSDVAKLSRIGGRTLALYLTTTVFAVSLGLILVNIFQPGKQFSAEKREEFKAKYAENVSSKESTASAVATASPLQPLIDIVPDNVFGALSNNGRMLQVIFFAILFGVALVMIDPIIAQPVKALFDGLNDAMIKVVEIIMMTAPYGVFALLASLVAEFAGDDPAAALQLFGVLGLYSLIVLAGLAFMGFGLYPFLISRFSYLSFGEFLKGIGPAQLLAFSTSSSAATLPVTMDCVEKNLGVKNEIASFVLPLGATVNMDGTSLWQAVSAVFIAQAFGIELSFGTQLGIVATATLASIGTAAVPSAGTVMLVIVLQQAGVPAEGLALILAVDRPLDMCRTVVNVTGDAMVCTLIAKSEGKLVAS
ncbi:dicarboxylate/amino acid:cation symporter [soil metagenome]